MRCRGIPTVKIRILKILTEIHVAECVFLLCRFGDTGVHAEAEAGVSARIAAPVALTGLGCCGGWRRQRPAARRHQRSDRGAAQPDGRRPDAERRPELLRDAQDESSPQRPD